MSVSDTSRLNLMSLQALLEESPEKPEMAVADLLPVGGTSLVPAKPKTGKSTLARCIAHGVATGTTALGRQCKQGPVLYLALEESRNAVAEHFAKMGMTGEEPIHIHIGAAPSDPLLALEDAVRYYKPLLVVIDPLQRFMRFKDINDYSEVSRGFEIPTEIARTHGCHLMFLHHLGKDDHSNNLSDAILGSTALFASVDLALLMRKTDGVRTIQTDGPQRFGIDLPSTVLNYNPETGMVTAGEEVAAARKSELRQHILNALGDLRLSLPDIKKSVGGDSAHVHSEVQSLHADGFLEREGDGKKGSPYLFSVRQAPGGARANGRDYHADEKRYEAAGQDHSPQHPYAAQ